MNEICKHSSGNESHNHCRLIGYPVERRVCLYCSKNTAAGVWPSPECLLIARSPETDLSAALTAPPELLGDRIASLAEKWGMDKLAAAYERMIGLPCGCAGRRELLNRVDGFVRGLLGKR